MSKSESEFRGKIRFSRSESNNRIYLAFSKEGKKKWDIDITDQVMGLVIGKLFADAPDNGDDSIIIKKVGDGEFKTLSPKK